MLGKTVLVIISKGEIMDYSILIITILALVFVFIIGRELICWYWKLNLIVVLLQQINDNLEKK
jgi:hypothetical protein